MVSRTNATETKRARRHKNMGARRKAKNRQQGSTPKFAIHQDEKKK